MRNNRHTFRLKSPDKNSLTPVSILYRHTINGMTFQAGVGLLIAPILWNDKNQRPVNDKRIINEYKKVRPDIVRDLQNLETRLTNIKAAVDTFVTDCDTANKPVDFKALRDYLDTKVFQSNKSIDERSGSLKNAKSAKNKIDLSYIRDYCKKFVHEIEEGKRLIYSGKKQGSRYSEGTIKNYKNFLKRWISFEDQTKTRYKWEDIKQESYNDFIKYLHNEVSILTGEGMSRNYVGRLIKQWKVLFQSAFDNNIHANKIYRETWFQTITAPVDNVALTKDELNKLYNLDLSNNSTWDKARDLFLIGCYIGQRISDNKRLKLENIKDGWVELITIKTKQRVRVPLRPELLTILNKHEGKAPKIAEQTVNELIKKIAEKAGINELVQITLNRGGKDQIKEYRKFELISTHTGRRTLATILHLDRVPTKKIMMITGHKSLTAFYKYIGLEDQGQEDELLNIEFFNKST